MLMQRLLILTLGATMLSACAADAEPGVSYPEGAERLASLLEEIDSIRQQANVASAGIALVSRDTILHAGGMGVLSWESEEPATADTLFRLGSVTKSFTGLTALHLRRKSPDVFTRPVNQLVPGLLGEEFGGDRVALPHLLEHTAGLSDLSSREFAFQGETVTYKEAVQYDPTTRDLRWPAAAHSSYSNAGFGYAGYVLESFTGRPFELLVQEHLLTPLGMRDAGFFITDDSAPLAAGYNTDGKTPIPYWHMLYRSFGGLNATPRDMSRFVQALLQPEGPEQVFLDSAERLRYENPSTTLAASTGLDYGYGLGNYHWFSNGLRFHGHGGDADGYLSHYGYNQSTGYGYFIVITAFNKKPLNQMREKLEAYIASLPTIGQAADALETDEPIRLPEETLSRLTGSYAQVTRRFGPVPSPEEPVLRIAVSNRQLETQYRGNRRPLVALSEHHFKRPWQPAATYAFITSENGDIFLQGDLGNFRKIPSSHNSAPSEHQDD